MSFRPPRLHPLYIRVTSKISLRDTPLCLNGSMPMDIKSLVHIAKFTSSMTRVTCLIRPRKSSSLLRKPDLLRITLQRRAHPGARFLLRATDDSIHSSLGHG